MTVALKDDANTIQRKTNQLLIHRQPGFESSIGHHFASSGQLLNFSKTSVAGGWIIPFIVQDVKLLKLLHLPTNPCIFLFIHPHENPIFRDCCMPELFKPTLPLHASPTEPQVDGI